MSSGFFFFFFFKAQSIITIEQHISVSAPVLWFSSPVGLAYFRYHIRQWLPCEARGVQQTRWGLAGNSVRGENAVFKREWGINSPNNSPTPPAYKSITVKDRYRRSGRIKQGRKQWAIINQVSCKANKKRPEFSFYNQNINTSREPVALKSLFD